MVVKFLFNRMVLEVVCWSFENF